MKRNRGKMILCTALACLCMTSMLPTFSEAAPKNIANATSIRQMREQSHLLKKKNKVSTKTNGITYPDRQPNVKPKSNGITYPDLKPK
ncbi:MAG: hypothetical protein Q4D65_10675 [Peptostreptococcaceae bacterium]|nr:hypothetical protein [Peptostreptococcaceae bacterium]